MSRAASALVAVALVGCSAADRQPACEWSAAPGRLGRGELVRAEATCRAPVWPGVTAPVRARCVLSLPALATDTEISDR